MGKLSLTFFVGVAACGSDNNNNVDAHVVVDTKTIDAPKMFLDAPPVTYDFTCFGVTPPATAADPVTISGETETIVGQTPTAVGDVTVETYKIGNATAVNSVMSDATAGTFMTGNLVTGAVPLDGYLKATLVPASNQAATYRTTFVYPPNKIVATMPQVPVPMISIDTFGMLNLLFNQNDATNGFLLITVADCTLKPVVGATLTVKQTGADVGMQLDIGQYVPQLAGVYGVANVPDGDTTLGGSFSGMTFPTHVVGSHKKPDANAVGTVTVSAVVPGPF